MRPLQPTLAFALLLTACLGDPAGPAVLAVGVEGAGIDTVWAGAPGEPLPSAVRLHVTDDEGRALPAASLEWEAIGRSAQVLAPMAQSDKAGLATAVWQLGTDAAEEQQLRVTVKSYGKESQIVIRARAVPHVVSQLRVALDTPAVVRLGDTLAVRVLAIDPYGNEFAAPDVALSVSDSGVASVAGSSLIGGRRGQSFVRIASHSVATFFSLHVKQYVAAIIPVSDSLRFSALGAQRPVAYVVRDDRGRVVADTTVAISVADPSVAQLDGEYVRALALGFTTLRLTLGPATAGVVVGVQQRVGSLALVRDTIRLDALRDTTTVNPIVHDSLGSPIANAALVYDVSDRQIAKFSTGRTLEAIKPGAAIVTVRDSNTSVSTSAPVIVRQVIASIDLPSAQILFDALGDTLTVGATARDRLGSVVEGAALQYAVSDTSVVALQSGSQLRQLRSIAPGQTLVVVTDPETGIVGTAVLKVAQRATQLRLATHAVSFDALGDTVPVAFSVSDRLGATIANASAAYRSTDPAVVAVTAGGLATSQENGSALLIAESPDGPADTVQVTVAQLVHAIVVGRDSLAFEALRAVQGAQVSPVDRRGAPVRNAALTYTVEDSSLAGVDQAGQVRAIANGTTRLLVSADGDTVVIGVHIAQRPVRVAADTIRFDALDDVRTVTAVAYDSLGSPVSGGVTAIVPVDTAVVEAADSTSVRARGNGVSTATVTVAGITGDVVVVVDQVAVSLNVAVTYGNPIVTLPAGSPLPLSCVAVDRNGRAIGREVGLVRAVKGTVAGSACADATVQRSGYDTLVFAMNGVQARVPVIVATRPDSVAVVIAAQPLPDVTRIRFNGEDLGNPLVLALRPLVQEILGEYGNPSTNLGRARALRDWVARTAVHPHPPLHPDASAANLGVLPPGKTWADVNALIFAPSKDSMLVANDQFWSSVGYDGYAMLDRLLGTLDPSTGVRADDGMMVHVGPARYQIRDLGTYKYPICTFQTIMLNALWAAAGLHGMLASTVAHDPAVVFIPELGRWVYEDPTFNEEYVLDDAGGPLSPEELLSLSSAGQSSRLHAVKDIHPSSDSEIYVAGHSYVTEHPAGMVIMGSQLNSRVVGIGGWSTLLVQTDVPHLAFEPPYNNPDSYVPVSAGVAFPMLGPVLEGVTVQDSVFVVRLSSSFPNHQRFERRLNGLGWESADSVDVLPVGATKVEYRDVDAVGSISASAVLDVWAPRIGDFVQAAIPGSVRAQARFWVSP